MENKNPIGIKDRKGNELFDGAVVRHKNMESEMKEYAVKWSDYRKQWIGDCPDEIYDLSSNLLAESELVTELEKPQP